MGRVASGRTSAPITLQSPPSTPWKSKRYTMPAQPLDGVGECSSKLPLERREVGSFQGPLVVGSQLLIAIDRSPLDLAPHPPGGSRLHLPPDDLVQMVRATRVSVVSYRADRCGPHRVAVDGAHPGLEHRLVRPVAAGQRLSQGVAQSPVHLVQGMTQPLRLDPMLSGHPSPAETATVPRASFISRSIPIEYVASTASRARSN